MTLCSFFLVAATLVGTWNGNWFPSGRAEHRAHPDVEEATIVATAKMLADAIRQADPAGTNDVILCLNEIRGPRVASNLVVRIGRKDLAVAAVSGYRRRDRFDQQQDVIATTLPVVESGWRRWRSSGHFSPPRGFAYARVSIHSTTASVYAVHLKSNYGATSPEIVVANRRKREIAVSQLLEYERREYGGGTHPVIVAGDMNADRWGRDSAEERLFVLFEEAGFANLLELLPPDGRGTHPSRRYGDSALDYVFVRAAKPLGLPLIVPNDALSDHFALFTSIE